MMTQANHPFHLVDHSPWPLMASIGTMTMMSGMIMIVNKYNYYLFTLGYIINILTMYQWWRDTTRESTYQGLHTSPVMMGLQLGMILFILSEIFFFMSFFWTFFHMSLSPSIELGANWPPMGIKSFNPFQIPLLNTMILLTSGITVTWAHNSLIQNNHTQTTQGLFFTILLGIYFTLLQAYEYMEAPFTIADSVYGSIFFLATGFHGIHVVIGTTFLFICLIRHMNYHFSNLHHYGFEAAAWYWHFVDIVWLFLFMSIYWWGE
uniref:cytochrome c oxidase subunit III n=1 Tax=Lophosia angusticauda TaxID=2906572 RepID=UPI0023D806BA|nr:cytochrome c oxidase subunit III [Lophosia angusticauda]WDE75730.1 cytochrome c oxidase subunit III [Lophosia angusticauda]